MKCVSMTGMLLAFCALSVTGENFESFRPLEQEKLMVSCGFEEDNPSGLRIGKDCRIVRAAGVNGNTGLVIERDRVVTAREIYSTLNIPDTVPGVTYRVEASIREEGLTGVNPRQGFFSCIGVESSWKDTGRMVPWRQGTTHFMTKGAPREYQNIAFRFTAKENMNHFVVLRMPGGWKGKLFFDDVKVFREGIQSTMLLTSPSTHSFEPGTARFTLRGDSFPEGTAVQVKLMQNGKVLEQMVLTPDKNGDMTGAFTVKAVPGSAEMHVAAGIPAQKVLVCKQVFPVNFLKEKRPVKGTVAVDALGRIVVNGKVFMPVGLPTDFLPLSEERCKRIADAGFNFSMNFGMLRFSAGQDAAHYFDRIRAGMDLLYRHNLYTAVTTAVLLDYYPYRIRKIGNAEKVDDKLETVVKALGNHPATLFYYNSDEVPEEYMDQVLAMRRTLNRLDPRHPVVTLTNDSKLLPRFAMLGDIFCADDYPVMKKGSPADLSSISEFMKQARRSGVPLWGYVQAFSWGHYKGKLTSAEYAAYAEPSTEEMRAMTWLFAIEGAKGFIFYTDPLCERIVRQSGEYNDPGHPERMWKNLVPVIRELRGLEPYIMGSAAGPRLGMEIVSGKVEAGAFQSDSGKTAVMIVAVKGAAAEAVITVPGKENLKSRYGRTENLGKGRYRFKSPAAAADLLE